MIIHTQTLGDITRGAECHRGVSAWHEYDRLREQGAPCGLCHLLPATARILSCSVATWHLGADHEGGQSPDSIASFFLGVADWD